MSEKSPHLLDEQPVPRRESSTAMLQAVPAAEPVDPTVSYVLHSTSGPNDPLRITLPKEKDADAVAAPDFPKLAGLKVIAYVDRGGMGHVYCAEQETPKRIVAVKIATTFNRAGVVTRERFDREIQALAAIHHPNIMPIYLAGDWHGFPFYAMRYMPGGPLSKQLGRLAGQTNAIVTVLRKVALGLQALHEAGIIHRDIKPHNILLDEHDEPVIADFGLAKWLDGQNADLTVTASALGTKYYMPPEQATGSKDQFGAPCDIWSFGIVLYEALTGQRPFQDDLPLSVYQQIQHSEAAIPDSVPTGLATIIRRCLQKRPEDRYPSVASLVADLDRWLDGTEIEAVNPPVAVPRKPKRRLGRWAAIGVALAIVAGTAFIAAAVWPAPPGKKKTIAQRLRAGETVTLIGEKGMPEDLGRPLLGAEGHFVLDKSGYCSLGSPDMAVRFLTDELVDTPFVLSLDCALLSTQQVMAYAGFVFGSTRGDSGATEHYLHMVQSLRLTDPGNGRPVIVESARIEMYNWGRTASGQHYTASVRERTVGLPLTSNAGLDWRTFEMVVRSNAVVGTWDKLTLNAVHANDFKRLFDLKLADEPEFGSGIGITAFQTDAVFRNLILKPVQLQLE